MIQSHKKRHTMAHSLAVIGTLIMRDLGVFGGSMASTPGKTNASPLGPGDFERGGPNRGRITPPGDDVEDDDRGRGASGRRYAAWVCGESAAKMAVSVTAPGAARSVSISSVAGLPLPLLISSGEL